MNEMRTQAAIGILRERWEARVALCSERLNHSWIAPRERELIEQEKQIYEIVLWEFVNGLDLPPR